MFTQNQFGDFSDAVLREAARHNQLRTPEDLDAFFDVYHGQLLHDIYFAGHEGHYAGEARYFTDDKYLGVRGITLGMRGYAAQQITFTIPAETEVIELLGVETGVAIEADWEEYQEAHGVPRADISPYTDVGQMELVGRHIEEESPFSYFSGSHELYDLDAMEALDFNMGGLDPEDFLDMTPEQWTGMRSADHLTGAPLEALQYYDPIEGDLDYDRDPGLWLEDYL